MKTIVWTRINGRSCVSDSILKPFSLSFKTLENENSGSIFLKFQAYLQKEVGKSSFFSMRVYDKNRQF